MKITYSPLSEQQKQLLCEKYPGITHHLDLLEEKIQADPLMGAKMMVPSRGVRNIPALSLSTETNIFSGALAYSKELTAVYVCSRDLSIAYIIQILL
jgi:hypothetical protein